MNIVYLRQPEGDQIIEADVDGWVFFIAYVEGRGECPHKHRYRRLAEKCRDKMRHWLDYKAAAQTVACTPTA